MIHRKPVALAKSYLLLNHGPVTLISSAHGDYRNVMAASWVMPLDFDPPKVAVVIDKNAYTRKLIEASGEFVINIPCREIADKVLAAGSETGQTMDKLAQFELIATEASHVEAPLIEGCVAWLECRIIPEAHNQGHYDLFIAEVVAAWADERAFQNGRWHFPQEALRTIHYAAGGQFFETGKSFEVGI